jgi:hypothetical protein
MAQHQPRYCYMTLEWPSVGNSPRAPGAFHWKERGYKNMK